MSFGSGASVCNNASSTTATPGVAIKISNGNNIPNNNFAVVFIATDNFNNVNGQTNEHLALSLGTNPCIKIREVSNARTGVQNGVTISAWLFVNNTGAVVSTPDVMATFANAVPVQPCVGWRFTRDSTKGIGIAGSFVDAFDNNQAPSAITVDGQVAGREHLFIRVTGGEATTSQGNYADASNSSLGSNSQYIAPWDAEHASSIRADYKIATAQTNTFAPTGNNVDWASMGFALYESDWIKEVPVNTNLLDDFNRADAAPMPATALWSAKTVDTNAATTLSLNGSMVASPTGATSNYTLTNYGPDVDIQFDMGVGLTSNNFAIYWNIAGAGTANFTCYQLYIGSSQWTLSRKPAGTAEVSIATANQSQATGDSIWIQQRGTTIRVWKKAAGTTVWVLVMTGTDGNITNGGPIAIYATGFIPTGKIDNLRGGTVVDNRLALPVAYLQDDFNRADGYVSGSAGYWTGKVQNGTGQTGLYVYSNTLGWNSTYPSDAENQTGMGGHVDLYLEIAAAPGASGRLALDFALINTQTTAVAGVRVNIDATGTWSVGERTGGSTNILSSVSRAFPAVGDAVLIISRDNKVSVYHRVGTLGPWTKVFDNVVCPTYLPLSGSGSERGSFGMVISSTTLRVDNFRANNYYGTNLPPKSRVLI